MPCQVEPEPERLACNGMEEAADPDSDHLLGPVGMQEGRGEDQHCKDFMHHKRGAPSRPCAERRLNEERGGKRGSAKLHREFPSHGRGMSLNVGWAQSVLRIKNEIREAVARAAQ